ncbi:hypothetical protein O181_004210 [Austropuccinia psidii MF-1]|uniref:Uncharacterized protein n=1 Tax=Austropuccinia psidii MF-1 TaxID=1389203 RepID=A0A9Q3BFY1_9BASI|nr:hypothetical protein [Austropuccinia psidii MF-1]
MESTLIQTSNQKDKVLAQQEEGCKQGRSPLASTKKPQASKPPQERKKNWRKPSFPSYKIPRIQKDAMDNFFNIARNLMEFKEKEEKKNETTPFPKEITL